jgi:Helicase associated domain
VRSSWPAVPFPATGIWHIQGLVKGAPTCCAIFCALHRAGHWRRFRCGSPRRSRYYFPVKLSVSVPDELWHQARSLAPYADSKSAVIRGALRSWVAPEQVEHELRAVAPDFQRGYVAGVECAGQLSWRAIDDLAERYDFSVIAWARDCADAAMSAQRARGTDASAGGGLRSEAHDVAAALAPALGPLVPGYGDGLKPSAPSGTFLHGFAQAMRDLWWSVAGGMTVTGELWGQHVPDWRDGLADAQDFYATHRHLEVPSKATGKRIKRFGAWVLRQRREYDAGRLSPAQIAALEASGMQWEGPYTRNRRQMIAALHAFHTEHGHADIPVTYITADGLKLGKWLADKKGTAQSGGKLHPETEAALLQFGLAWAGGNAGGEESAPRRGQAHQRVIVGPGDNRPLVPRRARKPWRCETIAYWEQVRTRKVDPQPGFAYPDDRLDYCLRDIQRGDECVEYRGETTGHTPGLRYCAACAVHVWGLTLADQGDKPVQDGRMASGSGRRGRRRRRPSAGRLAWPPLPG